MVSGQTTEHLEKSMARCPICNGRPGAIYQCNHCGEVRCGLNTCKGSKGEYVGWAGPGSQCRNCGKGRYSNIGFLSDEMDDFKRVYLKERREEKKREEAAERAAERVAKMRKQEAQG